MRVHSPGEVSPMPIVYVIDDDQSIRRAFSRLLRSEDFEVYTFSCPEEFFQAPKVDENACIIADVRMSGSTGFDLAEGVMTLGLKLPLIIISASDDSQTRQRARELGAVAFFRKPVDDQALLDAITWAISGLRKNETTGGG